MVYITPWMEDKIGKECEEMYEKELHKKFIKLLF